MAKMSTMKIAERMGARERNAIFPSRDSLRIAFAGNYNLALSTESLETIANAVDIVLHVPIPERTNPENVKLMVYRGLEGLSYSPKTMEFQVEYKHKKLVSVRTKRYTINKLERRNLRGPFKI